MDINLFDTSIDFGLNRGGWDISLEQGRLMLVELMLKADAGYYNSHTEEEFLKCCDVLTKSRAVRQYAKRWLCCMCYAPSSRRSEFNRLSNKYRVK